MRISPKKKGVPKAKVSTVPVIYWTADTIKNIGQMIQWPMRAEKARQLFLLDLSAFLVEKLEEKGGRIKFNDEEIDYEKNMHIGILEEEKGFDSVAMWLDEKKFKINEKTADNNALYFRVKDTSPDWVWALVENNPWPATMVPVPVSASDATVISRNIRKDERERLEASIMERKSDIEADFESKGMSVKIGSSVLHGIDAYEDIGFNVLRKELGMDGTKQQAHWRPALKEMEKYVPELLRRVNEYMLTGNESLFNLPKDVESVDVKSFKSGEGFMKEIKAISPMK